MLARVLELEIRSLKEADSRSGDEHLPGLREGRDTGDCMDGDAADIAGLALDLARVDAGADQQPVVLGAVANRGGAADSPRRTVEEGQEAVARGRDLQAPEVVELAPHAIAVACEDLLPRSVASRTATSVEPTMSVTSNVATTRSPASGGFAQPRTPANSMVTYGSSPTTLDR